MAAKKRGAKTKPPTSTKKRRPEPTATPCTCLAGPGGWRDVADAGEPAGGDVVLAARTRTGTLEATEVLRDPERIHGRGRTPDREDVLRLLRVGTPEQVAELAAWARRIAPRSLERTDAETGERIAPLPLHDKPDEASLLAGVVRERLHDFDETDVDGTARDVLERVRRAIWWQCPSLRALVPSMSPPRPPPIPGAHPHTLAEAPDTFRAVRRVDVRDERLVQAVVRAALRDLGASGDDVRALFDAARKAEGRKAVRTKR